VCDVLQARLGGTHRLVGTAAVAVAVYALMWLGWVQQWGWVTAFDVSLLDAAHRFGAGRSGWVTFWTAWCNVFSPFSLRLLTLALVVYELIRRRLPAPGRTAAFLVLSIGLSGLVTEVAKRLADRPRPATALVHALSTSFPSGHALGSIVALLALGVVYLPLIQRSRRPWLIATGALLVVSVGVGRVALNVHNPSDVVAGWALGYLYFLVCLPILRRPVTAAAEIPAAPGSAR
jgi:membrane-associated phospholipid phosphatase